VFIKGSTISLLVIDRDGCSWRVEIIKGPFQGDDRPISYLYNQEKCFGRGDAARLFIAQEDHSLAVVDFPEISVVSISFSNQDKEFIVQECQGDQGNQQLLIYKISHTDDSKYQVTQIPTIVAIPRRQMEHYRVISPGGLVSSNSIQEPIIVCEEFRVAIVKSETMSRIRYFTTVDLKSLKVRESSFCTGEGKILISSTKLISWKSDSITTATIIDQE
jgi:hypothetical protein